MRRSRVGKEMSVDGGHAMVVDILLSEETWRDVVTWFSQDYSQSREAVSSFLFVHQ